MMGDHRPQKLLVAHRHLRPPQRKGQEADQGEGGDQGIVQLLVLVHRTHDQQHQDDHRRDHHHGHVDAVDVSVEAVSYTHLTLPTSDLG